MRLERLDSHILSMKDQKVVISGFNFSIKKTVYPTVISIENTDLPIMEYRHAECAITVFKSNNVDNKLSMIYTGTWLSVQSGDIYSFFGFDTNDKSGNHFKELLNFIGKSMNSCIPDKYTDNLEKFVQAAIYESIAQSDPEDPNKRYCIGVKRNPITHNGVFGKRSKFNTEKTHKLRPSLFQYFYKDESLSFLYSEDSTKENNDVEIIRKYNEKHEI